LGQNPTKKKSERKWELSVYYSHVRLLAR
jgi:hypothetical protein